MQENNFGVGQKVFLKPVNNKARYGNKEIKESVVLKAGRKYFFVGNEGETSERAMIKFDKENISQVTNYSAEWELYFSKQEILDEQEYESLYGKIQSKFERWGKKDLTLDQLRRIHEIINE